MEVYNDFKTETGWKNSNPNPLSLDVKHPQLFPVNEPHDFVLLGK